MTVAAETTTEVGADQRGAITVADARLRYGDRTVWSGLDMTVAAGEFVAVLGPNGSGKTSLLRVLLGTQALHVGSVTVAGARPGRSGTRVGYIPQRSAIDDAWSLRARDLVGFGLDGHRWGTGIVGAARRRRRVERVLEEVGSREYADVALGRLSGGERQRVRVAQALVADPDVLLCDEPLLALDVAHQRVVSELIADRARQAGTAVLFVTHELDPVLPHVDRVLYLTNGRSRLGTPDEILTGE